MREVNAAWEVLRSPARRAAYDTSLRGDTPVWEQSAARPKRTAPVRPRVGDLQPRQAGGSASPASHWRAGPMIAVLALAVVAALGFAAWATSSSSSNDDDPEHVDVQTATPFTENSCVVLMSVGGRITPVPNECSAIGSMRIVVVTDLGRPCPSALEAFDLQADEVRLCLDAGGS
jgi:hypothetical protein